MAMIVREFTGDWYTEIQSCDRIHHEERRYYDEVIYFGPKTDLAEGGEAELFTQLSMVDRYNFNEQFAKFLVIEDPECRRKFGLDESKRHIMFLNGEYTRKEVMTIGEHDLSLQLLIFTLNTQMVKGSPRWGQRAFSSIFDFKQSAIIYYMDGVSSPEEINNDWRVNLMVRANEYI